MRRGPAAPLRFTGVLSAANKWNRAVSNFGRQDAPQDVDLGIESFEFWTPERRPQGCNLALTCAPPLCVAAFRVCIDGREIAVISDNHQTRRRITLGAPHAAHELVIEVVRMNGDAPAALCEVRCYG